MRVTSVFRGAGLLFCGFLVVTIGACSDEKGDVIVNASLRGDNQPPSVLFIQPEYPGNAVTLVGRNLSGFSALVADGNGLEDISAVYLNIESVQLNGVICRPDKSTSPPNYCDHGPLYVDNDTLDISGVVPTMYPGLNIAMFHVSGGIYGTEYLAPQADPYGYGLGLIDLENASSLFSPSLLTCNDYYNGYHSFRVSPPIAPTETEVYTTLVDVTLIGISVTVYDGAGESTTASAPDLRVTFMTVSEDTTLP